jgi:outer membrane biosynthesis protein TonB
LAGFVRIALTISAVAHALLWVAVTSSGPEPLAKQAEDPIMVDIVSPEQVGEAPKPEAKPQMQAKADVPEASEPMASSEAKPVSEAKPSSEAKPASETKPAPAKPSPVKPSSAKPSSVAKPAPQPPRQDQAQAQQPQAQPAPIQPPPPSNWLDAALVSLPTTASPFDDVAESGANLAPDEVETFKAHLHACWKPSAGLADARNLMVVLRVSLNPDGALAAEPTLLAASASQEGPALIETAARALRECQPYGFLPTAKYKEWKLLDLSFTPAGLSVLPRVLSSASP